MPGVGSYGKDACDDDVFFCASDIVGVSLRTVGVAQGAKCPVIGTAPGVFTRMTPNRTSALLALCPFGRTLHLFLFLLDQEVSEPEGFRLQETLQHHLTLPQCFDSCSELLLAHL